MFPRFATYDLADVALSSSKFVSKVVLGSTIRIFFTYCQHVDVSQFAVPYLRTFEKSTVSDFVINKVSIIGYPFKVPGIATRFRFTKMSRDSTFKWWRSLQKQSDPANGVFRTIVCEFAVTTDGIDAVRPLNAFVAVIEKAFKEFERLPRYRSMRQKRITCFLPSDIVLHAPSSTAARSFASLNRTNFGRLTCTHDVPRMNRLAREPRSYNYAALAV